MPGNGSAHGSQTLERGLRVLRMLAEHRDGLGPAEVAERLGVHRSIAYRLLTALTNQQFALRGADGRYRIGLSLFTLAEGARPRLVDAARPTLRELAAALDATACLVVAEGEFAVAVEVVEPPGSGPRFAYGIGNRDPLDRGAAGIALLAAGAACDREPDRVAEARRCGYIVTHGEVVPGAFGVAAPIVPPDGERSAAINVLTHRADIAERARDPVAEAGRRLSRALTGHA